MNERIIYFQVWCTDPEVPTREIMKEESTTAAQNRRNEFITL
jgi:hypothetical protein